MRIACLQFAPQLGDVDQNLNRADAVLSKANPKDIDLLVLPELAFSGYNFKSLKDISPYLEPTAAGITSLWARTTALKYDCVVTVGYPEKVDISPKWPASPEYYSSAITVNKEGETIANYRKSFLYYTDETWALEGPDGFYDGVIEGLGNVAMGICMDLNPYKFEAPWSAWEFAYHILHRQANMVIISMAWVTREDARSYSRLPKEPDMETLAYWVARLEPLIRGEDDGEVIVVLANRSGTEGDATYAGTSAVLGIQSGEVKLYGVLGRGERELLVVDTSKRPQAKLVSDPAIPARVREPASAHRRDPTQALSSGTREKSKNSTQSSGLSEPKSTQSSLASLMEPEGNQPSIDEVLGAGILLSPVEPISPHIFFASKPIGPEDRQPLKSTITNLLDSSQALKSSKEDSYQTLKSAANGIDRNDSSTPAPDTGVFERPSSPKSRNASRTRQPVQQEQALYTHDLAGVELLAKRPPSQNRTGYKDIDMDVKRVPASLSVVLSVVLFVGAFVGAFVGVFVGEFVGVFVGMACVSKYAIQCPSPSCNFAYFASSPDPAGKLRNHFNNFKSRDAEHESYFQKPFCVFCSKVIVSKTRKGLWKTDMNKHWLVDHSTEFAEPEEHHERQEMVSPMASGVTILTKAQEIAVILSPSQLQRLANEWQLEYELDEGDVIIRKGRATHLRRGMIIARCTSKQDSVPSLKRRRTSYEQIQPVEVSHSAESSSKRLIEEASVPARVNTQNAPVIISVRDEYIAGEHSTNRSENETSGEGCLFSDKRQPSAGPPSATSAELPPGGSTPPHLESYTGDAFAAMSFCFPGFEDDIGMFRDSTHGAE
ncbi:hypothetical protein V497_00857 [Pseudogymnoascus sp. VKM F-4516 (FW-969)]|nr:hypothetical protein V497_00857 [Pseudogymnoascus sp. VKM F-4516 (FW-969)]